MSLTFLNALLWPLVVLVSLPLVIHLFARARPPVLPFSSVTMIRRMVRHTQRIKRPRDWLLWLIRTVMIASLILLFLKPLWFANPRLAAPGEQQAVVILVDASASMAIQEGGQSRFVMACAEASDILNGLGDQDRANIIWLRNRPESIFPAPAVNIRFLQDALRTATVSLELGRPRDAIRLALDMLREIEGRRQIYIISDFQASNWRDIELATPPDVSVALIRVGGDATPDNVAIRRILIDPPHPVAGETVTLFAEIENFSRQPARVTVLLEQAARRDRQPVTLAPRERDTAIFMMGPLATGMHPVAVRIDEDAFAGDNERYAVIPARSGLQTRISDTDPFVSDAWMRALDATEWFSVELWSGEVDAPAPDAILLAGDALSMVAATTDYLREGGLVIWAPPAGTTPEEMDVVTGTQWGWTANTAFALQDAPRDRPFRLRVEDRQDPVFDIFADGVHGDPAQGWFRRRLQIPASTSRAVRTLLQYTDGTPAILHGPVGQGSLVIWNVPVHEDWTDWADQTTFLPFLSELIWTHRSRIGDVFHGLEFEPGDALSFQLELDVLEGDIELRRVDGERVDIQRRETESGALFVSVPVAQPGHYEWRVHDTPVVLQVVNFPAAESEMETMDPTVMDEQWVAIERGRDAEMLRSGLEIGHYFLLLALVLSVLEGAVLWENRRR